MNPGANLYSLVAEQASRTPHATAVVPPGADRPITYAEVVARADAIAAALDARRLRPEAPVGVLTHRDRHLIPALLAVLKAGGAYLPLDPDDPPERARLMLLESDCRLVVGHADLCDRLRAVLGPGIDLVDVTTLPTAGTVSSPARPGGDRLAYVLFTSGSTGTPKGVEVEHRAVVSLLTAARDLLRFSAADRYLAVSTIGFDISVAEIFLPLVTGGSVVLRDRALLLDPHGLADEIRRHHVTVFQTGPSVWAVILRELPHFPRLRVAITTGEAIAPALADTLASVADEVWNLYGPTEATVWATGQRLQASTAAGNSPDGGVRSHVSAPIGGPLAGVETLVVDETGGAAPDGARGELWLGGRSLARGYRGRTDLTSTRFVAGPDGRRYYRTGDIVARDDAGLLQYFGRGDDQIKIRGVRIEPSEVESALCAVDGIAAAAATWFETPTGARSVVAVVVPARGAVVAMPRVRAYLESHLPAAMVPTRCVVVDALPLTTSGKIDRHAIRAMVDETRPSAAAPGTPVVTTATEQQLIAIWERVLGVGRLSRDSHFFSVGGDSLAAVTTLLHVEDAFGVSVPVRGLFESPTISAFAQRIDDAELHLHGDAKRPFIFPLVPSGRGRPVFFCGVDLKIARRGFWTFDCPLYSVTQWAQGIGFARASSVPELARLQLAGMRTIQPQGPYRLAGFSFGGLVALEMAHQLRSGGEEVELLFLLDPTEPYRSSIDGGRPRHQSTDRPLGAVLRSLASNPARYVREWIANNEHEQAIRSVGRSIVRRAIVRVINLGGGIPVFQWCNYQLMHLHGRHPNQVSRMLLPKDHWPAMWYATIRLARSYVAPRYAGAAGVVLTSGAHASMWRELLSANASVVVLASKHGQLFGSTDADQWLAVLGALLEPEGHPSSRSAAS